MAIRLVACDIDDTLLRFPDLPSPRVTRALHAARDAGVTVVLVTGRAFHRAQPIAQSLGLTTPIICNHGGSIRNVLDGRLIHHETMPRSLTLEVVTWLQAQEVHLILFGDDHIYHDCLPEEVVVDFQVYTRNEHATFVLDLGPHIPEQTEIILTTSLDHAHLAGVFERAKARFGKQARVLFAHPFGVDILSQRATKSRSLAWLADHLGIARKEVMAIGDGGNDVDMLAWAGLGVAMGNGVPEAKAAADAVVPSFDQDGLAWAVERYILSGRDP
jgi:Cof subfamily protein (haloacid dehalogenase superfamily)